MAFNDINNEDDIISWEKAYSIFSETQKWKFKKLLENSSITEESINNVISELNLNDKDKNSINTF